MKTGVVRSLDPPGSMYKTIEIQNRKLNALIDTQEVNLTLSMRILTRLDLRHCQEILYDFQVSAETK